MVEGVEVDMVEEDGGVFFEGRRREKCAGDVSEAGGDGGVEGRGSCWVGG